MATKWRVPKNWVNIHVKKNWNIDFQREKILERLEEKNVCLAHVHTAQLLTLPDAHPYSNTTPHQFHTPPHNPVHFYILPHNPTRPRTIAVPFQSALPSQRQIIGLVCLPKSIFTHSLPNYQLSYGTNMEINAHWVGGGKLLVQTTSIWAAMQLPPTVSALILPALLPTFLSTLLPDLLATLRSAQLHTPMSCHSLPVLLLLTISPAAAMGKTRLIFTAIN